MKSSNCYGPSNHTLAQHELWILKMSIICTKIGLQRGSLIRWFLQFLKGSIIGPVNHMQIIFKNEKAKKYNSIPLHLFLESGNKTKPEEDYKYLGVYVH